MLTKQSDNEKNYSFGHCSALIIIADRSTRKKTETVGTKTRDILNSVVHCDLHFQKTSKSSKLDGGDLHNDETYYETSLSNVFKVCVDRNAFRNC